MAWVSFEKSWPNPSMVLLRVASVVVLLFCADAGAVGGKGWIAVMLDSWFANTWPARPWTLAPDLPGRSSEP
jgi:hypothetical protein